MKRIYTTLALLVALVTGAYAQDTAYVQTVLLSDTLTFNNCSTTDSVLLSYAFINRGAYTIKSTDSFGFNDLTFSPSTSGTIYETATDHPTNDTIVKISYYIKKSDLGFAYGSDGNGGIMEFDTTQITNGIYIYAVQFFGFYTRGTNGFEPRTDLILGDSIQYNGEYVQTGDSRLLIVNCPATSIKDALKNGASLNVFPNPATNQINFNYNFVAATTTSALRITDISGRVVKTMTMGRQNAGNKSFNIDIADLNNGMYYIELTTDQTRSIAKFTKN